MTVGQGPPSRRHGVPQGARFLLVAIILIAATLVPLGVGAESVADEDGTIGGLARINEARAAIGVPALKRHAALDAAATAHANYYKANFGDPSLTGMGLHYEDATKPGFTGADFAARAKKAGYSGSVNENIGLSGNLLVSIEWFLDTVNHRLPLIDPRYTDIGFGVINDGKVKIEVIDLGTIVYRSTIDPVWEPWPPPDSTGINPRFDGEGNLTLAGVTYPSGYPITLKYNGASKVAFTAARLTAGGAAVPSIAQVGSGFMTRNTYIIVGARPLQPGTTFVIAIDGTLDGVPFTRTWSFTTRGTPSPTPAPTSTPPSAPSASPAAASLPPGVAKLDPAAVSRWKAADYDVWSGAVQRTWTWGPDVLAVKQERYDGAPGQTRTVYYFDKSRMEINNPQGDRTNPWFITNGLLVREMIAGQVQVGDATFMPLAPPAVPLTGETPGSIAVTYAALGKVASLAPGQNGTQNKVGATITATIDVNGVVGNEPWLEGAARYGYFDPTLSHNVADVFWRWLGTQPVDWVYAVGFPLCEPYWTNAKIGGDNVWVLVQVFERRVLTFVPTAPAAWQIEAGNVGLHYYQWRYGDVPR